MVVVVVVVVVVVIVVVVVVIGLAGLTLIPKRWRHTALSEG